MADEPTLTSAPGQPMPGVPQKIGRFEIRRQLGEGSFGAVYLAYDPDLDREVALKIPGGMTPASRAEFLKEARAAAKVMHPNVCQVFEVSKTEDNPPFIVSRFVGGGTLADYIRKANGNLPIADALKIAGKIASGLAAAHAKGIVHRDLKPGNILYDDETDDFLITDFGLAKVLASASQSSGGVKGTPLYMSPEQFGDGETAGDVGPLSDVYALGVILYELLTGVTPFTGNPLALMLAHLKSEPKPPSARRAEVDASIDALCLKALSKSASDRYLSAKLLTEALREHSFPSVSAAFGTRKPGDRIELALPGLTMPFAYCPSGEFLMGSPPSEDGRSGDEFQHRVVISNGFHLGVEPVTRGQFALFVAETNYRTTAETSGGGYWWADNDWEQNAGCTWRTPGFAQTDAHPVVVVSWNDAIAYCKWASKVCERKVRLPTEAEWEYACRGGTKTPFHFGSQLNGTQANCDGTYPYGTTAKGPFAMGTSLAGAYGAKFPHKWGLCDVHGNVWEWCSDWYDGNYYSRSATTNPRCTDGRRDYRSVRGGSWSTGAGDCRTARRRGVMLLGCSSDIGFRVALH